ncbi:Hsp70 family protein [Aliiroseovarius sp. KMU-50]|uniref:Hsp70 family protein n=1 Tax=Aliiroseovarius salicola TaxID=3009082 RepID=A0ABT4W036_9RHOB|nr:Hsp70 family protein [Aliiroseovarius sp. KMU-50]MDA5093863.1 Hsp70 family protein [Aliiroseovarius sp. KMU-50]
MSSPILAVDFGTSNTAVAMLAEGHPQRVAIEAGADTLPTAVFFPTEGSDMQIGAAASASLIEGEDGRYMRALKSILGHPLFHESRLIGGKRQTLAEVVTAFLVQIKSRAEAATGEQFTQVLSGRPVHFHSDNADQDRQAEADLRACYHAAGFEHVDFLFEPEAAAHACHAMGKDSQTGLIIDIGGGTSDFTVFRSSGGKVEILASHGIRLGGTDFDQKISMAHVMPLLGHGGQLRRTFGDELLPMPNAIFQDLATWAKIPFLYTRETERKVEDLLQHAVEPEKVTRLKNVIEDRLGHELAFAVEAGKIAANAATPRSQIEMGFLERDLTAPITSGSMNAALTGYGDALTTAIYQTLMQAQMPPTQIDTAILVGGSSLMRLVSETVGQVCPGATLQHSEAFTAVVDGLAIATTQ